jgi:hypothetical protein
MSKSMVKGTVICKCRVQKVLENSDIAKTVLANLLVSAYTGSGLTSFELSLTEDNTLYIEALRKDTIGIYDVAYTDIIPREDIKKFEVKQEDLTEVITIVAIIRGKEETFICYRENTKEDYIATMMQGLLEPRYTKE